jgi:hypothetical protein
MGEMGNAYKVLVRKPYHVEDPDVVEKKILVWILRK